MTQEKYTTKGRKFKHLTSERRAQIELLLRQGVQKTQIVKIMGISRSALYREIGRGTAEQIDTNLKRYRKYFWDVGQRVYEENRKNSRPQMKLMDAYAFVAYAENRDYEEKSVNKIFYDNDRRKAGVKSAFRLSLYIAVVKWHVKNRRCLRLSHQRKYRLFW